MAYQRNHKQLTFTAHPAQSSRHFLETLVQREVVSHRVLPARRGGAVEWELPLYPLVDLLHGEGLSGRAF